MIIRKFIGIWMLLTLVLTSQACRTPPKLASELKLLVISDDDSPGKSIGPVRASDCGYRYAGIGKYPSFKAALKKSNARYLRKVELKQIANYLIYSEYECKSVWAEGFK
jgi:hypothetical protein